MIYQKGGGFIFCIFFVILVISKREGLLQKRGVHFKMVYMKLNILVIFCISAIFCISVIFCILCILCIFNIFPIFGAENNFLAGGPRFS